MIGDPFVFVISAVFLIPAVLVAIPAHELGHALAATWMGDPTAKNRGFLRLEPRLFFEPYGLLAAFLARVAWGAPVPVNEYRLTGVGRKLAYALGGPVANLLLGAVFGLIVRFGLLPTGSGANPTTFSQPPLNILTTFVYAVAFLNLSTFAFQLLPIPGLDGWRILEAIFRSRYPKFFFQASGNRQQIWMICVIVVFIGSFFAGNLLDVALFPFYAPASHAVFGICTGYPGLTPCPRSGGF